MLVDQIKLESNEEVLVKTRRHWFILWSQIAAVKIIVLLPLIGLWVVSTVSGNLPNTSINLSDYWPHFILFYCLLLAFAWISIFSIWTNYYLDVLTVTNRRAVLIDQKGFFSRYAISFRLERMQDMHIEINGLLATLLDYGTLRVETASGHANDELRAQNIPKPSHVKSVILQAADNLITTTPNHDGIAPIDKPPVANPKLKA